MLKKVFCLLNIYCLTFELVQSCTPDQNCTAGCFVACSLAADCREKFSKVLIHARVVCLQPCIACKVPLPYAETEICHGYVFIFVQKVGRSAKYCAKAINLMAYKAIDLICDERE